MQYSPILPPGIHEIGEAEIDNHFAACFPSSSTRLKLIAGLCSFFSSLRQMEIAFEIWIDGSFTTKKLNPNDIDLVVFADSVSVEHLSLDGKID